jgi:hypothetical protein
VWLNEFIRKQALALIWLELAAINVGAIFTFVAQESGWQSALLRVTLPAASFFTSYKGFPTFVKQNSIVVNRVAIDHET